MKYLAFGLVACCLGFIAQWFGLSALVFVAGHFYLEGLAYSGLAILSSVCACFYSGLFIIECVKDHPELLSKPDES